MVCTVGILTRVWLHALSIKLIVSVLLWRIIFLSVWACMCSNVSKSVNSLEIAAHRFIYLCFSCFAQTEMPYWLSFFPCIYYWIINFCHNWKRGRYSCFVLIYYINRFIWPVFLFVRLRLSKFGYFRTFSHSTLTKKVAKYILLRLASFKTAFGLQKITLKWLYRWKYFRSRLCEAYRQAFYR